MLQCSKVGTGASFEALDLEQLSQFLQGNVRHHPWSEWGTDVATETLRAVKELTA